jgi:DNA-binding response OmpR family regulator
MTPARILVVDDEPNITHLIRQLLENRGYLVSEAYDGQGALDLVAKQPPDLILLNVVMPVMDGFEVCRRLKGADSTKHIPILFISGQYSEEYVVQGYDLGADHYVTKPFSAEILFAQIRRSLKTVASLQTHRSVVHKSPRVFISYKWEADDHNDWVMNFAVDLRRAGIDAALDRLEVRLGDSFVDYMTSKIAKADVVLFVMTAASVAAVEDIGEQGGAVKFEMQLASSRKLAGESLRIIPVYREGKKTAGYLRDLRYADFRDDSQYHPRLQELVLDLLGSKRDEGVR